MAATDPWCWRGRVLELETNLREVSQSRRWSYYGLILVESGYYRFHIEDTMLNRRYIMVSRHAIGTQVLIITDGQLSNTML